MTNAFIWLTQSVSYEKNDCSEHDRYPDLLFPVTGIVSLLKGDRRMPGDRRF